MTEQLLDVTLRSFIEAHSPSGALNYQLRHELRFSGCTVFIYVLDVVLSDNRAITTVCWRMNVADEVTFTRG